MKTPRGEVAAGASTGNHILAGTGPEYWSSPDYSVCSSPTSISPTMPSRSWTGPIGQPVLDRVSD